MQSSKYYDTVFHLKKEFTKSNLVLYLSFILVTWSLLQISLTDFFENNDHTILKIPSVYSQDDGGNGDGGDGGGDDGGDGGGDDGGDGGGNGGGDGGGDDGGDGGGDDGGGDDGRNGNGVGDDGEDVSDESDDNGDNDDVDEVLSLRQDEDEDEDDEDEDAPEVLTFSEDRVSEVLSLKPNEDKDTPEVLSLKDGEEEDTGASAFFGGTGATGIEGTEPEPTTIPPEPEPTTIPPEPEPTTIPPEPEPTTIPPEPEPTTIPPEPPVIPPPPEPKPIPLPEPKPIPLPEPKPIPLPYVIIKIIDKNKIIVKHHDDDDDDNERELLIISDRNTCPTQTDSVTLSGKIKPKGIRLLADFYPCKVNDGSVTLNMPNTQNIKLAVLHIDRVGNNNAGTLVNPIKIQDINTNQALYTIELDYAMTGKNPVNGQRTTVTNINGLALYNVGNNAVQFESGNIAALTSKFTR